MGLVFGNNQIGSGFGMMHFVFNVDGDFSLNEPDDFVDFMAMGRPGSVRGIELAVEGETSLSPSAAEPGKIFLGGLHGGTAAFAMVFRFVLLHDGAGGDFRRAFAVAS